MGMAGADATRQGGGIELELGRLGRWWGNRTHASEWVRKISDFVAFLATVVLVAAAAVYLGFAFADGSVKSVSKNISIVIFQRISTRAGHEVVDASMY